MIVCSIGVVLFVLMHKKQENSSHVLQQDKRLLEPEVFSVSSSVKQSLCFVILCTYDQPPLPFSVAKYVLHFLDSLKTHFLKITFACIKPAKLALKQINKQTKQGAHFRKPC